MVIELNKAIKLLLKYKQMDKFSNKPYADIYGKDIMDLLEIDKFVKKTIRDINNCLIISSIKDLKPDIKNRMNYSGGPRDFMEIERYTGCQVKSILLAGPNLFLNFGNRLPEELYQYLHNKTALVSSHGDVYLGLGKAVATGEKLTVNNDKAVQNLKSFFQNVISWNKENGFIKERRKIVKKISEQTDWTQTNSDKYKTMEQVKQHPVLGKLMKYGFDVSMNQDLDGSSLVCSNKNLGIDFVIFSVKEINSPAFDSVAKKFSIVKKTSKEIEQVMKKAKEHSVATDFTVKSCEKTFPKDEVGISWKLVSAYCDRVLGFNANDEYGYNPRFPKEKTTTEAYLRKLIKQCINEVEEKNIEWGFDLTDIKGSKFEEVLKAVGITNFTATQKTPGKSGWTWEGKGIKILTGNNPITGEYSQRGVREDERGYASYIGIFGTETKVKLAVRLIKQFASGIKDESPNRSNFIRY